jgi:2-keto-4-pentenoate hydratase/2-oxohepta-3-ene-1,7-dioic acid hydratase in catechol pathway
MKPTPPYALGTFSAADRVPFAAIVIGDAVTPLVPHLGNDVTIRGLLDDWDASLVRLGTLASELERAPGEHRLDDLRPRAPYGPVGQIFQAGANYRSHVLDMMAGAEKRGDVSDGSLPEDRDRARAALDDRASNGQPFVFLGSAHAVVGATDDVVLPPEFAQHDWELELAVVIGHNASRVAREEAFDVVAGYTICNDVTMRDALIRADVPGGIDWLAAKNSPTFLPTGPLLVPRDFVDPGDLRILLRVNGRAMQDESTADIMFDIPRLIEYVSTIAELRPGDLLLTGSPAGNGASHGVFLADGDIMEGSITGLGFQRNRCTALVPSSDATAASQALA